jgi:succinate dehydrogenase/fumarate reductase-like Fe-S protein
MTQERIVATILFITFLIVAYKILRMLYKRPPMGGSTSCSSGSCGSCAFNTNTSCEEKSYIRKEQIKVEKLKV